MSTLVDHFAPRLSEPRHRLPWFPLARALDRFPRPFPSHPRHLRF